MSSKQASWPKIGAEGHFPFYHKAEMGHCEISQITAEKTSVKERRIFIELNVEFTAKRRTFFVVVFLICFVVVAQILIVM